MTPYYDDGGITIYQGDALTVLKSLPAESVQTCVTSPPYWGLRDYQVNGQIGLETTPEAYVEKMVEVFREVRRVLREDGTCWLNLGSSYAGSWGNYHPNSPPGKHGQRLKETQRWNRPAYESQSFLPPTASFDGKNPNQSPLFWRAPACGSDGKEREGSQAADRVCPHCGGERQGERQTRRVRSVHTSQSALQDEPQTSQTGHDTAQGDCAPSLPDALLPDVPASTMPQSSGQPSDASCPEATASAFPEGTQTSSPASRLSSHRSACTCGTSPMSPPLAIRTRGKESFFSACGRYDCNGIGRCGLCWCSLAIPSLAFKRKDQISIPQLVAFALQADGWYLRSDIIWCLSGGTWVYARTQKGDMPMMVRDMARLDPATVKLWNGSKWTQLLGISKTSRKGEEIELVLRSGERISCTPSHRFPTQRGLLEASDIRVGDVLQHVHLPEPENPRTPEHIGREAAWFAGLYIAEGSRSGDTIQIASHAKEEVRWHRVKQIAEAYGGTATRTVDGNTMNIRIYGKVLNAIIDCLVTGDVARTKAVNPVCWRYSNRFLEALLEGYLSGDGHWDAANKRWRIGFTRNYNLERDIRVICARLGYHLTLNLSYTTFQGKEWPTFRGEIRLERSGHHNEKDSGEVVSISKARCREVYDLGVEDEPHLFALASGVMTHNSKPNPMPESVTDRPTRSHEYLFLLAKSQRYYYDHDAIKETGSAPITKMPDGWDTGPGAHGTIHRQGRENGCRSDKQRGHSRRHDGFNDRWDLMTKEEQCSLRVNKRSVWTIATAPFLDAHFATFPPKLIEPCILAGSKPGDVVLDPFHGAGTTMLVAKQFGRQYLGIELKREYIDMSLRRLPAQENLALFGEGTLLHPGVEG